MVVPTKRLLHIERRVRDFQIAAAPFSWRDDMSTQAAHHTATQIPIMALGWSLGIFLALTFTLCVAFGLIFSGATMYQAWLPLLPWVTWISWTSFVLGLVEAFAYGWFVALIFGPLFNYFSKRLGK